MCRTDRSKADGKVEKTQVKDHACRDGRGCCGNRCCQKQKPPTSQNKTQQVTRTVSRLTRKLTGEID